MSSMLKDKGGAEEQQDAPLTEEERKLVSRLFSDPTHFPVEYRTWLRVYLEGSGMQLPASSIVGGDTITRVRLPPGYILPYAGETEGPNVMFCDGRSLLRSEFTKLFNAIGVKWGSADATHFNIPDLRDRTLFGTGSGAFVQLGATDGQASGARGGPRHHHDISQTTEPDGDHWHNVTGTGEGSTSEDGSHEHGPGGGGGFAKNEGQTYIVDSSAGSSRYLVTDYAPLSGTSGAHWHDVGVDLAGETDEDGAHTHLLDGPTSGGHLVDMSSYAGINWIITTGK